MKNNILSSFPTTWRAAACSCCMLPVIAACCAFLGYGCDTETCTIGEARCIDGVPWKCYRNHNAQDEFDPPAWHKSPPCEPGYACVVLPDILLTDDALCVYGGSPYPACPDTPDMGEIFINSICEEKLLVYCSDEYRVDDEMCAEACTMSYSPDNDRYTAECSSQ